MRLENFLIKSIKDDLYVLINQYIDDTEDLDEISDLENEMLSLDDMTLEELVNKNLEYVHKHEMEEIMKSHFSHYLEVYVK